MLYRGTLYCHSSITDKITDRLYRKLLVSLVFWIQSEMSNGFIVICLHASVHDFDQEECYYDNGKLLRGNGVYS